MVEKYLVIYPSGEMKWQLIPRDKLLDRLHEIIGCSCVEQVHTVIPNLVMIVDESGRIKRPPQTHNELASWLYGGWLCGMDDIVGPAVFAALRPVGPLHELDWFPLVRRELAQLSLCLGIEIPDPDL